MSRIYSLLPQGVRKGLRKAFGRLGKYSRPIAESIFSLGLGCIVGSVIVMASGLAGPLVFLKGLFIAPISEMRRVFDMLSYVAPLVMTALSFAVASRAGLFNIGAEGQMYVGALAALLVGYIPLPPIIHQMVALIAAFVVGGAWGAIAGVLKIKRGVNEVISTIMMNSLAYWAINYLTVNRIYDPKQAWRTKMISESSIIPFMAKGTTLSVTLILAIVFGLFVYFVVWRTPIGYEIRAVGESPTAAEYGGVSPARTALAAMLISGGCAGLAGAFEVLGRFYFLDNSLQVIWGRGFDGIAVSLVGRNHPFGIMLSSVFFAMLDRGASAVQVYTSGKGPGGLGVPYELVLAVMGVIITATAAPGFIDLMRRRIRRRRET